MTTDKASDAFRTISEAADELGLEQHVLRFWETRFTQIKPLKRGGGRRYYRPDDVDFLRGLKFLLHDQRYTIKGVQKIIKEQGVKTVAMAGRSGAFPAAANPSSPAAATRATLAMIPPTLAPRQVAPQRPAPPPPVQLGAGAGIRERLDAALAELKAARQILAV